jgi:hypothetical protein
VAQQFSTSNRAVYQARSGYFETDFTTGFYFPLVHDRLQLLTFATVTSYAGASNRTSPLLRTDTALSLVTALVFIFDHSSKNEVPEKGALHR